MNLPEAVTLTHDLDGISVNTVMAWAAQYTGGNQAAVMAAIAKERQRRAEYLASRAGMPMVSFLTANRIREWRAKQATKVAEATTTNPPQRQGAASPPSTLLKR